MRPSLAAILFFVATSAFASVLPGDRWPVRGTPVICGREIPQFVLLHYTLFDYKNGRRFSGRNLFIPVSQDQNGVFYHAQNGLLEYSWEYGNLNIPGGLYVNKTKPNLIYFYTGDARKPGWVLDPELSPLPMKDQEKLRIGHFSGKEKASKK